LPPPRQAQSASIRTSELKRQSIPDHRRTLCRDESRLQPPTAPIPPCQDPDQTPASIPCPPSSLAKNPREPAVRGCLWVCSSRSPNSARHSRERRPPRRLQ